MGTHEDVEGGVGVHPVAGLVGRRLQERKKGVNEMQTSVKAPRAQRGETRPTSLYTDGINSKTLSPTMKIDFRASSRCGYESWANVVARMRIPRTTIEMM